MFPGPGIATARSQGQHLTHTPSTFYSILQYKGIYSMAIVQNKAVHDDPYPMGTLIMCQSGARKEQASYSYTPHFFNQQ
ncbi:hypothetical protein G7K_0927-t1 [Saitoella complicata NRRL Y-17804]|uniref:Uncharacterized protein n=1 Tax=Saitoella complicata (strain BCRC 22490 / CBS 7301 / JCM 7358 / NBRC 10748 / NRRL Y-17804) TaxID=698492 RepID=A0A0E9NA48_SAICN|nr:hypothetical protein G7K_0927-t1 [Saitoella complicata NRRL Y-17804]